MSSSKENKIANINKNYLNFVFMLSCICLVIVGGILASNDTTISSTFADKGINQNKNEKSKEVKSSNFKEKQDSSDKRYIGDKGSQNHKKEKSSGEVKPIDNKKEKSSGKGEPVENGQNDNNIQPQPVQRPEPIIITNTVTTTTPAQPSTSNDDNEEEHGNEGPTRFAFIDSFFTDQTAQGSVVAETSSESSKAQDIPPVRKLEVEPGEGDSILAIVLINRGFSDVTSIRASLDFPSGFKALVTPKNTESDTAMASFNGIVNAGKTFTLYFPINISNSTLVGKEYSGSLKIKYFNVAEQDEEDTRDRSLRIPFKLSGKAILDAIPALNFSNVVSLVPGEPNTVRTLIKNEGSGVATGVIVDVTHRNQVNGAENNNVIPATTSDENVSSTTVQQSIEVIPLVTAGTTRFNVGTIPAGGSVQIDPIIFPSDSVGSILENMELRISYNDAYGNRKTLNELMGVHILPTPPQSGLSISSAVPTSNSVENLTSLPNNILKNNEVKFGNVTNDKNNKNDSYSLTQVSDYYYSNNPNLVSNEIKDNTVDVGGTPKKDKSISLVAGKVDDLKFNITNSNNRPITNAVVTLNSDSDSLKILGNSKWNLGEIRAGTTQQFVTSVFASKSLINSPVSFKVLIDYIYNGEAKSDSFNLGANVVGNITADINDLAINYIGGIPNLIGNILNKGNTLALFTTIELVGSSSGTEKQLQEPLSSSPTTLNVSQNMPILKPVSSFPQYLGDLDENSPLPFSIPLAIDNHTAPGVYPVSLKITYSDDLRNSYSVIRNGTVQFISTAAPSNQGQSFLINNNIITIIIFIIIALGVIFTLRWLRSKRSKGKIVRTDQSGDDNDFESLLGHDDSTDKMDLQKK
jgi:hypothetical protein